MGCLRQARVRRVPAIRTSGGCHRRIGAPLQPYKNMVFSTYYTMVKPMPDFEWDSAKNRVNRAKHGIGFELAQHAFLDPFRVIAEDLDHGGSEQRYFCFGRVEGAVVTVRFTWRNDKIRIFGAGYWRKGKAIYEKANG
jgi:uncharacterized DUF497 family protein